MGETCSSTLETLWHRLQAADVHLPRKNPTFGNPAFDAASLRVLIVRLSPHRDVERSTPHLFLFQAVRRALPAAYIDFAFFPPLHDRARLTEAGVPWLHGIASHRAVAAFDLLLISNAYTLELINVPLLLLQSDVPLLASQRDERWPLLILGGSNASAAQAIITEEGDSMVDAVFFGEGERQVERLVHTLAAAPSPAARRGRLSSAADAIDGLWVAGDGQRSVRKAVLRRPGEQDLLTQYPLLNGAEAQTARLQVDIGCPAFCAFCYESYDRKPYREFPLLDALAAAEQIKQRHGPRDLEVYSFNANSHSDVLTLLHALSRRFDRVSVKSQRADLLHRTQGLLEAEILIDKRSFTLGVEGISSRLRAWLQKSLATTDIDALLERLLQQPIRQIKLFYLLTGYETKEDVDEFRAFVGDLKALRQRLSPRLRITFSFGWLIRMPFTPLRYDRLLLEPDDWHAIAGPVKSACETHGFEFRMAMDWDEYCTSQVLAAGGTWLHRPLTDLALQGHCYDQGLTPGAWPALRIWMETHDLWDDELLGIKDEQHAFPLEFLQTNVSAPYLFQRWQQLQAGLDPGYCLGAHGLESSGASLGARGECLQCGACADPEQRRAIVEHTVQPPLSPTVLADLEALTAAKRRLQPLFIQAWLPDTVIGATAEWIGAWVLRALLADCPALADYALSLQDSLFTVGANAGRFPNRYGETVLALRCWEPQAVAKRLEAHIDSAPAAPGGQQIRWLRLVDRFDPGQFEEATLTIDLPCNHFPNPGRRLIEFLRATYVPCNVLRDEPDEDNGQEPVYRLDLPSKALRKRVLLAGSYQNVGAATRLSLRVSAKFDLDAYLRSFSDRDAWRLACCRVDDLRLPAAAQPPDANQPPWELDEP